MIHHVLHLFKVQRSECFWVFSDINFKTNISQGKGNKKEWMWFIDFCLNSNPLVTCTPLTQEYLFKIQLTFV